MASLTTFKREWNIITLIAFKAGARFIINLFILNWCFFFLFEIILNWCLESMTKYMVGWRLEDKF